MGSYPPDIRCQTPTRNKSIRSGTWALTYSLVSGLVFDWRFAYFQSASAMTHRYIGSQYNAGAVTPVRRDIGVQPVAISTARIRFSF